MDNVKQFAGDKILRHSSRIKEFFRSGKSRPITVEFDMTNLCNHKCPFCFGYYKRDKSAAHMSSSEAKAIIDQLKDAGSLAITFTGGGDPLVNKSTIQVMEYTKSIGLDVALITNGLALSPDISKRALGVCTWLRVSVDASDADTYKKTHGVGKDAWETMIANLKKLVSLKKESGSECTIGVGYLTTPDTINKEKMLSFVRLFKEIGVDYSQFRPLMPRWDEKKEIGPDDSLSIIQECIKESGPSYDVLYSKPKYELMKKNIADWRPYGVCLGVNFTTVVSADKKVYVCCHHRGVEKYAIGDLSKETFSQIWDKRQKTFDRIDFRDCPYFCRNNPFNMILWDIKANNMEIKELKEKRRHENFL